MSEAKRRKRIEHRRRLEAEIDRLRDELASCRAWGKQQMERADRFEAAWKAMCEESNQRKSPDA